MIIVDLLNFIEQSKLLRFIAGLITLVTIAIIYKIFSQSITRTAKKLELDPHPENMLRIILRVVMIIVSLITVFSMFGIPTEWFIGSSALIGVALGFGHLKR